MKKQNSIDLLIENLARQFNQINGFNLMQESEIGNKMFDFVIKHSSGISAFKNLFIQYYLPAATKSSHDLQKELKNSKYKNQIKVDTTVFRDNYYETIRLGYVGAYHKYESYLNELVVLMNVFFKDIDVENKLLNIEQYSKNAFDIDIKKSINNFLDTNKINWISNCVKHYDGFPIKEPIPIRLKHFDKTKKIEIESSEFRIDLDRMLGQTQLVMNGLFMIGFHQFFSQDFEEIKDQLKPENQNIAKVENLRNDFAYVIREIFNKNIA
jgi:hypothetical protein